MNRHQRRLADKARRMGLAVTEAASEPSKQASVPAVPEASDPHAHARSIYYYSLIDLTKPLTAEIAALIERYGGHRLGFAVRKVWSDFRRLNREREQPLRVPVKWLIAFCRVWQDRGEPVEGNACEKRPKPNKTRASTVEREQKPSRIPPEVAEAVKHAPTHYAEEIEAAACRVWGAERVAREVAAAVERWPSLSLDMAKWYVRGIFAKGYANA